MQISPDLKTCDLCHADLSGVFVVYVRTVRVFVVCVLCWVHDLGSCVCPVVFVLAPCRTCVCVRVYIRACLCPGVFCLCLCVVARVLYACSISVCLGIWVGPWFCV